MLWRWGVYVLCSDELGVGEGLLQWRAGLGGSSPSCCFYYCLHLPSLPGLQLIQFTSVPIFSSHGKPLKWQLVYWKESWGPKRPEEDQELPMSPHSIHFTTPGTSGPPPSSIPSASVSRLVVWVGPLSGVSWLLSPSADYLGTTKGQGRKGWAGLAWSCLARGLREGGG